MRIGFAGIRSQPRRLIVPSLLPTRPLDGYQLDRKIGEGGSSIVYEATALADGRRVAIKIAKGDGAAVGARIKSDFRAARRLHHRNVVQMHRLLPHGDGFAAVMERLEGPSLSEYVRGTLPAGRLPPLTRLYSVTAQLAAALAHMHALRWVHGDIKPDNVHCTAGGTPRLLDFDLATFLSRPLWMPTSAYLAGTFAYLPPEAILGSPAAPPADMFSFGRLVSKLVCGRLPSWDPGLGASVAAKRIRQQLPPDTPRPLLTLCTQLVRVAPGERLSAAEVYYMLCGEHLPLAGQSQRCEVSPQVREAARDAMERADGGRGSLLVVETHHPHRLDAETLLATSRSEEPRLFLAAHCDDREQLSLRGFDAILDQLALWIEQIPENLRADLRRYGDDAVASVHPPLAAALRGVGGPGTAGRLPAEGRPAEGRPAEGRPVEGRPVEGRPAQLNSARYRLAEQNSRRPRPVSDAACKALAALIAHIAQERTVILCIQGLEHMDEESRRLLARLAQQMSSAPIVIAATTAPRRSGLHRPVTLLSTAVSEACQMTVRV